MCSLYTSEPVTRLVPPCPDPRWITTGNLYGLLTSIGEKYTQWTDLVHEYLKGKIPKAEPLKLLHGKDNEVSSDFVEDTAFDFLFTERGTPYSLLTEEIVADLFYKKQLSMVIKATNRGTFVLLLVSMMDGIKVVRTPFHPFQPLRYSGPSLTSTRMTHYGKTAVAVQLATLPQQDGQKLTVKN